MQSVKIKSIRKIGYMDTYDINTPKYNNFLLDNGVLSHNSSKTFDCLSCGESWYEYRFKEKYPIENVCFSIGALAKRIHYQNKEGKLRKGEMFVLEEAGANFGSLDFQNKLNKMFNYILQSFRSMNLIVVMNLPVLTMLNKSARQLIHAHFITAGIDFEKNEAKVKPYFHQLNQHTGKSYWKFPKARIQGKATKLERIKFKKPTEELIEHYEKAKHGFVFDLTEDLVNEVEKDEREHLLSIAKSRKGLSIGQLEVIEMLCTGMTQKEIAQSKGCTLSNVSQMLSSAHKNGYDWEKYVDKNKILKKEISPKIDPPMRTI